MRTAAAAASHVYDSVTAVFSMTEIIPTVYYRNNSQHVHWVKILADGYNNFVQD